MSDAYAYAAKGKLKLKSDTELKKKKKKHKNKDKEKEKDALQRAFVEQQMIETVNGPAAASTSGYERKLTKAELATKKQQEKMRNKRIMDKAQTTHKQRVEKFNEHLDTLTEHFDIPKVSWTK